HAYSVRTQCQRFRDVRPAPEPTIDDDRHPVADSRHDVCHDLDGRHTAIELPAAVVAQKDPIAAEVSGLLSIRNTEHSLAEQLAPPEIADPGDVVPRDRGAEELWQDCAAADCRCRAAR